MRRRRGRKSVTATITDGSRDAIFGLPTDPAKHAVIDDTGWVRESRDGQPLTAVGRIFCSSKPRPGQADYTRRKSIVQPVFGQIQVAQDGNRSRLQAAQMPTSRGSFDFQDGSGRWWRHCDADA